MAIRNESNRVSNLRKADAFFNISVATNNGDKQIGGIPLYLEKELHAFLIENAEGIENAKFTVDIHVIASEEEPKKLAFA